MSAAFRVYNYHSKTHLEMAAILLEKALAAPTSQLQDVYLTRFQRYLRRFRRVSKGAGAINMKVERVLMLLLIVMVGVIIIVSLLFVLSLSTCWWSQDINSFSCQFLGTKKGS